MSQRDADLQLLDELLTKHADEITDDETEAFASMRFDLQAYRGILGEASESGRRFQTLTERQRSWAAAVRERVAPQYQNLISSGAAPRGREVPTPAILQNLPKRPPPRRRDDE